MNVLWTATVNIMFKSSLESMSGWNRSNRIHTSAAVRFLFLNPFICSVCFDLNHNWYRPWYYVPILEHLLTYRSPFLAPEPLFFLIKARFMLRCFEKKPSKSREFCNSQLCCWNQRKRGIVLLLTYGENLRPRGKLYSWIHYFGLSPPEPFND